MRLRLVSFIGVALAAFMAGAALGFFKKSELYSAAQHIGITKEKVKAKPYEQLVNMVFSEQVYEGELVYEAINELSGVKEFPARNLISSSDFVNAYDSIIIINSEQLYFEFNGKRQPALKITFSYQGKEYRAFVYGTLPEKDSSRSVATFIIPGSGMNQSSAIYSADSMNYHFGIFKAVEVLKSDVFVLVKPNEDFLAFHNGSGRKVSSNVILNYHLNRGSSYSASYLIKAMAFIKWSKANYNKTVVAGLSQGGAAALLVSVHTQPDVAIISSGHSILFDDTNVGSFNQLLGVPGYVELFPCDNLQATLEQTKTKFLFTWGQDEGGYYGIESSIKPTASCIKDLSNVDVAIHNGGHIFPVHEIQTYLTDLRD